jgi:hypothetical protein
MPPGIDQREVTGERASLRRVRVRAEQHEPDVRIHVGAGCGAGRHGIGARE